MEKLSALEEKSLSYCAPQSKLRPKILKTVRCLRSIGTNTNTSNENQEAPRSTRNHKIRYEQNIPHQFTNSLMPLNAFEQKDRFLRRKLTPEFQLSIPTSELESALLRASGNITFTLFREATRILDIVCKRFKSIDNFVEKSFGPRISVEEATEKITEYIKESNLPTNLDVIWCEDLLGSALMCSTGVDKNGNIPRNRKFTMLLKTNEENTYLRERGIICLMDHELGTHYHRSFNEGLQPWYGKRDIYGLGSTSSNEAVKIEEGLACLHTILRAEHRYLGVPALLYYGSCMAEYLPFKDLFEHLGKYVADEEQRWKHCMRIKRCVPSQDQCGGYGKDQRYFEGAVTILRQQANIDFPLLMSGKLTLDELDRARRCAITSPVRLPSFMINQEKYLATLRQIARMNGVPIVKSYPRKSRSRSVTTSSDIKCPAIVAEALPTTKSSPTMHSPRVLQSKHSATSTTVTALDSEAPDSASRGKPAKANNRIFFPILDHSSSQNTHESPPHRRCSSKKSPPTVREAIASKTPELPPSTTITGDEPSAERSEAVKLMQQAIRNRLLKALAELNLPRDTLSNTIIYKPHLEAKEGEKSRSPSRKLSMAPKFTSKVAVLGEVSGLQNGMGKLPTGVCGCRLFTHGSFRTDDTEMLQDMSPTSNHSMSSPVKSNNSEDPPGVKGSTVPMILEVDLRHPLIGV
ncbi:unnamed protein product [Calicophoron daubneyi]|uniref:Uncharacterized protein n=1 Tax=Calicophoron daubneyi TaxID=300641 RepID=A0AAV2T7J5_CALDB